MKRWKITDKTGFERFYDQDEQPTRVECWGLPERLAEDGVTILPAEYTIESWEVVPTKEELTAKCLWQRQQEYPTPQEFMDAYFDGGQGALDALAAKRQAVKAKYPKP